MINYLRNLTSLLLFGTLIVGVVGCWSNSDCCTIIDTDVSILYKNAQGDNLINSTDEFKESNIRVYYKNGNDFEYVFNGNLDAPNMHRVYEDQNENLSLTIFPSNFYKGNQSTTLVELNPSVVDTLVCEFELDDNREICTRAWLNGVEMANRYLVVER